MRKLLPFLCLFAMSCSEKAAAPLATSAKQTFAPVVLVAQDAKLGRPGEDWPAFLGPKGTSVSSEKGLKPWPADGPRLVWHAKIGEGYAAPTIAQGKLFHFDRVGDNARLLCLDPKTGKEVWTFTYPTQYVDQYNYSTGPRCCPVVEGDYVYIHGVEGMLHCLKTKDGSVVWQVDTQKTFGFEQNFFGVGSTPIVEKDLLLVHIGGSKIDAEQNVIPNGSGLVAFDKLTGKVRWQVGDELASYSSPVLATIENRRWCFVLARGGLLAVDPATGKLDFHFRWRAPIRESVNAANPVVVGNQVLISETYGPGSALLKVQAGKEPEVVWSDAKRREKSLLAHWTTPIYHEGNLFGDTNRHPEDAELRCLEFATGKVLWSQTELTHTSLLQVDGHLVTLTERGELLLVKLNPKKYEEVARVRLRLPDENGKVDKDSPPLLRFPCWAAPVLSHGLLYVRGEGRLVCLELIGGKE